MIELTSDKSTLQRLAVQAGDSLTVEARLVGEDLSTKAVRLQMFGLEPYQLTIDDTATITGADTVSFQLEEGDTVLPQDALLVRGYGLRFVVIDSGGTETLYPDGHLPLLVHGDSRERDLDFFLDLVSKALQYRNEAEVFASGAGTIITDEFVSALVRGEEIDLNDATQEIDFDAFRVRVNLGGDPGVTASSGSSTTGETPSRTAYVDSTFSLSASPAFDTLDDALVWARGLSPAPSASAPALIRTFFDSVGQPISTDLTATSGYSPEPEDAYIVVQSAIQGAGGFIGDLLAGREVDFNESPREIDLGALRTRLDLGGPTGSLFSQVTTNAANISDNTSDLSKLLDDPLLEGYFAGGGLDFNDATGNVDFAAT